MSQKKPKLSQAEHVAISEMRSKGESISAIARILRRDRGTIRGAVEEAKALLDGLAPFYARQHAKAAERAADRGDSRPAEWALERIGVVKPLPTGREGNG